MVEDGRVTSASSAIRRPSSVILHQRSGQERNHDLVMPREHESSPGDLRRPLDDVHARPVVLYHVEVGGRETPGGETEIPRNSQRLQEHLREEDRGTDVHDDPSALKVLDHIAEHLEIPEADDWVASETRMARVNDQGAHLRFFRGPLSLTPCF